MKARILWAVPLTLLALAACFFVAGDLDAFGWDPASRAFTVIIAVFVFAATVTCPYIEVTKS